MATIGEEHVRAAAVCATERDRPMNFARIRRHASEDREIHCDKKMAAGFAATSRATATTPQTSVMSPSTELW